MYTPTSKTSLSTKTTASPFAVLMTLAFLVPLMALLQGCSGAISSAGSSSSAASSPSKTTVLSVTPSATSIPIWQTQTFSAVGAADASTCTWESQSPTTLANLGGGMFQAIALGTGQVTATCGTASATTNVAVTAQTPSGPITITKGGTYSGIWNSTDPNTPAVSIHTDEPVILQDSTITSRGRLIDVHGVSAGANVTIQNVTGTALDPQVAGMQRGAFVLAASISSLVVKNCTMYGVSYGVLAEGGVSVTNLKILNNVGSNLEDRASDGNGGLLAMRPTNGHFIILAGLSAPNGAEIAWNQLVQAMGQTSTEDPINIYQSQGAPSHSIWVHDNYMEGYSSAAVTYYTGNGIITDGSVNAAPTAYTLVESNEVVHTAGGGFAIAFGHDNTFSANRIVSCGVDNTGHWFNASNSGIIIWDIYQTGRTQFYNNTITGTVGGAVGNNNNQPMVLDTWANTPDLSDPNVSLAPNSFTDPCLVNGKIQLQAEDAERAYWKNKLNVNSQSIGDLHSAS